MTPNAHIVSRWGWLLALAVLMASPAVAQRIDFGVYTTSARLTATASGNLNFNAKQPIIAGGSNASARIALTDVECQSIGIVGDATSDVTITVSAPRLTIPFDGFRTALIASAHKLNGCVSNHGNEGVTILGDSEFHLFSAVLASHECIVLSTV